jgi:hypothetical protein
MTGYTTAKTVAMYNCKDSGLSFRLGSKKSVLQVVSRIGENRILGPETVFFSKSVRLTH